MRANLQQTALRAKNFQRGRLQTSMVATNHGEAPSKPEWADACSELHVHNLIRSKLPQPTGKSKSSHLPDRSTLMPAYIGAGDTAFFGVPPVKFHLGLDLVMHSNRQGTHLISMELYLCSSQQLSRDLTNTMINLLIKIC